MSESATSSDEAMMVVHAVHGAVDQLSEVNWKSLRYFAYYRVSLAGLLLGSLLSNSPILSLVNAGRGSGYLAVSGFYFLAALVAVIVLLLFRQHFNLQLSLHVLLDVVVLTILMHFDGGLRSGLGAMLLVMLAGAGLVGQGRLVLFYAAIATLSVLFEQTYRALNSDFEVGDFFQAGLFCASFFGVAISARLLARRVTANETLAQQRGVDLSNQILVSQRVIEEMQDGILVLNRQGVVKQHNPRAGELLGLSDPSDKTLASYSSELARCFTEWSERPSDAPGLVRAPASGLHLSVRFLSTDSSEHDVLVFLEDTGRLQEQARQLKLAALGRLTASIAHEIRNPLSAIRHASELLAETVSDTTGQRLSRIVIENSQRVERIVNDVLSVGRRDRSHREMIDLRQTQPIFIDEYVLKESVGREIIDLRIAGDGKICFDRSHFHQVLWNLVGNALRYSRREPGSIRLQIGDANRDGWVDLHVRDDGEGVPESFREQVFEPFFTTFHRGTGLGLYIARELCEANGAHLELMRSDVGADFCITGRAVECR